MKESGLPNWAKTPDSKEAKQGGTTAIIEEEGVPVKKEPFSKRRDSSESANGKRKDSGESKPKAEAKTPQTPVKAAATPKKTPAKEKTAEKSPLKRPPSPSPLAANRSLSKMSLARRLLVIFLLNMKPQLAIAIWWTVLHTTLALRRLFHHLE